MRSRVQQRRIHVSDKYRSKFDGKKYREQNTDKCALCVLINACLLGALMAWQCNAYLFLLCHGVVAVYYYCNDSQSRASDVFFLGEYDGKKAACWCIGGVALAALGH